MIPEHLRYNIGSLPDLKCKFFTEILKFSEFVSAINEHNLKKNESRLVAMDISPRRVGMAISNRTKEYALPMGTIHFDSNSDILEKEVLNFSLQKRIVDELKLTKVSWIVGWPLDKMGKIGKSTDNVLRMMQILNKTFKFNHVLLYDERYTTEMARGDLIDRKISGKKDLDSAAATRILQEFLDTHSRK